MKALFSITYYAPYVSGLTLCAKRLAESLASRGHTLSVLCMQHDRSLPEKETLSGVSVHRVPYWFRFSKGFISGAWVVRSWRAVRAVDTVIINLPQPEGVIPAVLAKIIGKRVVVIYHCELVLPPSVLNTIISWGIDLIHVLILHLADRVVCYTEDYAKQSRLMYKFLKKCNYIYPPIPYPNIDKRTQKIFKEKIGAADHIIGIAARLAAEKGVEYVLEALRSIKKQGSVKLAIAGPLDPVGEVAYKRRIMRLVEQLGDQVVFLGTLSQAEMPAFYAVLDVLVLPSLNATEAFGMVQVEAMLCGVPVVASDLPGVRIPITVTGMGRIVPSRDSRALAEAIEDICEHRSRYIKPQAEIRKIFSLEDTIAKYEKLLIQ